jgi:hypothetical protein
MPFCNDEPCCDLVGDIRPFCVDFAWDEMCVAIAHLFCDPGIGADRCKSAINGSCFEAHGLPGCVDETCCNVVCALDPFCCENFWDEGCVQLANLNCVNPGASGPTPDLTNIQGYLRPLGYDAQPGGVPSPLAFPAPAFQGHGGQGYFLFDPQYLTDHPGAPIPQRYTGLYGLGRNLNDPPPNGYGVGPFNGARGRGIKVAVIEWAYYQGHEDLDVISEPGQTLIMIPEVSSPDHATACLGIINAQINGKGMNGIAPDAQAYFFPLTSVEEGPREFAAWVRMMQTLGHGDVVSCSYGPSPTNLNCVEAMWTLIRMASDLGITVCVAAGNSCFNLDDAEDFGDSGCIVVGAGTPGRNHPRLTFSNFYQEGAGTQGNIVHVQAWGQCVPALAGTANVWFPGGNWNRSYCNNFNGTSAACPQVAAIAACLQGLAKQFYGIPLLPGQIRGAITGTGFPQDGVPNPDDLPGFPDDVPCGPDTNPEEGPNKIGPFPRPERAGANILSQTASGFDDSPLVDDVLVIRGDLMAGNRFSLKGRDGNYLVVNTLFTPRKYRPSHLPRPASQVQYLNDGQMADIMVIAHTDKLGNTMEVGYEYLSPGGIALVFTEMYDFVARKWQFLGFEQVPEVPGTPVVGTQLATAAQRFVNQADGNKVYIRQYVTRVSGPPAPGSPSQSFPMRWDWLNLSVFSGQGEN